MSKGFLIRRKNQLYCSKCGEKLLQDGFKMDRHIAHCRRKGYEPVVLREGKDYVYSLEASQDRTELHFIVLTPVLAEKEGFFRKETQWEEVYRGIFRKNEKTVEEQGLYNIDIWLENMENIPNLTEQDVYKEIRAVFPDFLFIFSLYGFVDFYRAGRCCGDSLLKAEEAEKILSEKPLFDDGEEVLRTTVRGKLHRRKGRLLLQVGIKEPGQKEMGILTAGNYLYGSEECGRAICLLIEMPGQDVDNQICARTAKAFDRQYPSFMLWNYLENGGRNVLIPLFGAKVSRYVELLYKAGMPYLAENADMIIDNNDLALEKKNLSDIFGLPVKTLRKFSFASIPERKGIFDTLKRMYAYDRRLLSLSEYNYLSLQFLTEMDLFLTRRVPAGYGETHIFDEWSKDDLFRTLKYISGLNGPKREESEEAHRAGECYADYLKSCRKLGTYIEGKWPKDLKGAHDRAAELYFEQKNRILSEHFHRTVSSEEYQILTTEYEGQKDVFLDDPYMIISPKCVWDMHEESSRMHNCVQSYIGRVAGGDTKVYFLRQKQAPDESLCTIEVNNDRELIQLKAFANRKAEKKIQRFVRKWAKIKGITFRTYDMG